MKEDLKILNVEYLSNHQLDLPQIVNLSLGYQTKFEIAQNEDDLQCRTTSDLKVEYLSNHGLDFTQILKWSLK